MIKKINKDIYQIYTKRFSSHSYLIKDNINTLIDPGMITNFNNLKKDLAKINTKIEDIKLVLNTHEHIDHVSCNLRFKNSEIAAHKTTAKRIENSIRILRLIGIRLKINTKVDDGYVFNLGKHKLRLIYTPGHSIGSCCFYEEKTKFLFSGDTVFAYGTPALITSSGSKKDYIESLRRLLKLDIKKILPGHGSISEKPKEDIKLILKRL